MDDSICLRGSLEMRIFSSIAVKKLNNPLLLQQLPFILSLNFTFTYHSLEICPILRSIVPFDLDLETIAPTTTTKIRDDWLASTEFTKEDATTGKVQISTTGRNKEAMIQGS